MRTRSGFTFEAARVAESVIPGSEFAPTDASLYSPTAQSIGDRGEVPSGGYVESHSQLPLPGAFADAYPVEEPSHNHESPRGLQGREDPPQPGPSQASSQPQASTSSYQDNEPITVLQTQLRRLDTIHHLPPFSHSPVENYTTASPPWSPIDKPTDFETRKRRISDITGVRGKEYPLHRDYADKLQEDWRIEEGKDLELIEGEGSDKRRSKRARKRTKGGMSSSTWTKRERKGSDGGHPPAALDRDELAQPLGSLVLTPANPSFRQPAKSNSNEQPSMGDLAQVDKPVSTTSEAPESSRDARISALIKQEIPQEHRTIEHEQENPISDQDPSINGPEKYIKSVQDLQQQIFDLGKGSMGNVEYTGDTFVLPLVLISEYSGRNDMRSRMQRVHQLALSIQNGLLLAAEQKFTNKCFNIIVQDPERPQVLRIARIEDSYIEVLLGIIAEAAQFDIVCSYNETAVMDAVLTDLLETASHILKILGLDLGSSDPGEAEICAKGARACEMASSLLSIMFLGLVSFTSSHISTSESIIDTTILGELRIETIHRPIYMSSRRLRCLDSFLKHPVWSFSMTSATVFSVDHNQGGGFYLLTSVKEFAILWGPLKITGIDTLDSAIKMKTRGGFIAQATPLEAPTFLSPTEQLCHWYDWVGDPTAWDDSKWMPIDTRKPLLIGARTDSENSGSAGITNTQMSACPHRTRYFDNFPAFELKAKFASWKQEEKVVQIGAGQYITAIYGHTWKFEAGWTLKDVIIEDWVESIGGPLHLPKPFYLDYHVVLEIDRCRGNCQRTSLWTTIKSQSLRAYFQTVLDAGTFRDFKILTEFFSSTTSFTKVWMSITEEAKKIFKIVISGLLGILRSTGVAEGGLLQAWDLTSTDRLDGRRFRPPWCSMLKDDLSSATFALIANVCLSKSIPKGRHMPSSCEASVILKTTLCITSPLLVHRKPSHKVVPVSSRDGKDAVADFEQWRVSQQDSWKGKVETVQTTDKKLDGIRSRHLTRRKEYKIGNISDSVELGCSTDEATTLTGNPSQAKSNIPNERDISKKRGKRMSKQSQPYTESFTSLDFKNGKHKTIGRLNIEYKGQIKRIMDIDASDEVQLEARWEECTPGLLANVRGKGKEIDKRIREWADKKSRGVLPWMINHIAEVEEPASYAIEHIRGEELRPDQQLRKTYIQ
jgi:hypothetical protein